MLTSLFSNKIHVMKCPKCPQQATSDVNNYSLYTHKYRIKQTISKLFTATNYTQWRQNTPNSLTQTAHKHHNTLTKHAELCAITSRKPQDHWLDRNEQLGPRPHSCESALKSDYYWRCWPSLERFTRAKTPISQSGLNYSPQP